MPSIPKKQKNQNYCSGFSLIELVIYLGIASLIILVLSGTIIEISRIYARTKINQTLSQNGNNALQKLTREILSASSVNTTDSNFIDAPNILALNQIGHNYGKFYVADNGSGIKQLYFISENTSPPLQAQIVTSDKVNVENFLVNYSATSPASLKLFLILSNPTAKYNIQETYTTTINLRNY
jgi:Tfp pilus assembly protein PilW